ncbi:MAG TPA: NADH-quinone oxidoreductase subunit C [Terriglobales bacterium]|nr:NADH-quinone oxidoreductase subunit C [Terriglobales bacterium]
MSEVLVQQLQKYAEEAKGKVTTPRKGEMFIEVDQTHFRTFTTHLVNDLHVLLMSTITGLDLGQTLGIIYNFEFENLKIQVKTTLPKNQPTTQSIVDIVPGAILYEMEIHDMFGIMFTGNPWINLKLLLPDNWPSDLPPPLLKISKPAEIRKRLQLEAEHK